MSDTPKVSVIVPIYNPGKTILRGLNSLHRQTLTDIEILLVNDGSEDGSLAEARDAAREDARIRILDLEANAGPGIARNHGIEEAAGEYLAFVDADDYISPDFLARLYRKAELYHADIAKASVVRVSAEGVKLKQQIPYGENSEIKKELKAGKKLYTLFRYDHYSAIYNRKWVMGHDIRYGTSRYGEDSTFLLKAGANARRIVFDDTAVYYFVDQRDSLMNRMTKQRLNEQLLALKEQIDFLTETFGTEVDLDYEMQRIRWTLGVQAAAVRQGDLAEEADSFLTGLRSEVMRLPNLTTLILYSPMIGALVEYRENLSGVVMRQVERDCESDALVEGITRCFRFASMHPKRKDLYAAPLRESLKRSLGYLCGAGPYRGSRPFSKEKLKFTRKLMDELRINVDPLFWQRFL